MKKAIGLLKRHFPYRLHAVYIINIGLVFETVWNILKPAIPKKALRKTVILKQADAMKILLDYIGHKNLEADLGGLLPFLRFNDSATVRNYIVSY
jgi:hypothetical protein